jgi:hypothetical protein
MKLLEESLEMRFFLMRKGHISENGIQNKTAHMDLECLFEIENYMRYTSKMGNRKELVDITQLDIRSFTR